jgi:arginine decarboxylase
VNVRATKDGYEFAHIRPGDTTDLMHDYVGYDLKALRQSYTDRLAAAGVTGTEAEALAAALDKGLTGYTYLAETAGG